ncbi:MAG TPA: glycoside hydrolase family 71 protein [Candidatus Saccharimonadales bacterium]
MNRAKVVRATSLLAVMSMVSMAGVILLRSSQAATPFVTAESEKGSIVAPASSLADATAAGGAAVKFGSRASTGVLPFDLPPQATLKASSKKVFAHYFVPYPISFDNKPADQDYYATGYLNPNGEGGKFAAYGGMLRERPLTRPVSSSPTWEIDDMRTEVKRATEAGLDGFALDVLCLTGQCMDRTKQLLEAAPLQDPNFKIMLMPDGASLGAGAVASEVAASMASLTNDPKYNKNLFKLPDGRVVFSAFMPEVLPAAWWQNWLNIMKNTYGVNIAFVPCFLNYGANAAAFMPFSYGASTWGNRSPASNPATLMGDITDAHNRGKIWMQAVSLQDNRPIHSTFWEANNTENLRQTWNTAISSAEWVQIATWNDYSENAQVSPSTHIGWSPLDISSYYLTWMKQGSPPQINKDVLYVNHRIQPHAALPTGPQTQLMKVNSGQPPRDTVEVLSFLTAAATITTKVGGNTYTYEAPAGVYTKTFPLATGTVSAVSSRSGSTTASAVSPFPVVARPVVQDLTYHFTSSAR